jgi:hypothetical protein
MIRNTKLIFAHNYCCLIVLVFDIFIIVVYKAENQVTDSMLMQFNMEMFISDGNCIQLHHTGPKLRDTSVKQYRAS